MEAATEAIITAESLSESQSPILSEKDSLLVLVKRKLEKRGEANRCKESKQRKPIIFDPSTLIKKKAEDILKDMEENIQKVGKREGNVGERDIKFLKCKLVENYTEEFIRESLNKHPEMEVGKPDSLLPLIEKRAMERHLQLKSKFKSSPIPSPTGSSIDKLKKFCQDPFAFYVYKNTQGFKKIQSKPARKADMGVSGVKKSPRRLKKYDKNKNYADTDIPFGIHEASEEMRDIENNSKDFVTPSPSMREYENIYMGERSSLEVNSKRYYEEEEGNINFIGSNSSTPRREHQIGSLPLNLPLSLNKISIFDSKGPLQPPLPLIPQPHNNIISNYGRDNKYNKYNKPIKYNKYNKYNTYNKYNKYKDSSESSLSGMPSIPVNMSFNGGSYVGVKDKGEKYKKERDVNKRNNIEEMDLDKLEEKDLVYEMPPPNGKCREYSLPMRKTARDITFILSPTLSPLSPTPSPKSLSPALSPKESKMKRLAQLNQFIGTCKQNTHDLTSFHQKFISADDTYQKLKSIDKHNAQLDYMEAEKGIQAFDDLMKKNNGLEEFVQKEVKIEQIKNRNKFFFDGGRTGVKDYMNFQRKLVGKHKTYVGK